MATGIEQMRTTTKEVESDIDYDPDDELGEDDFDGNCSDASSTASSSSVITDTLDLSYRNLTEFNTNDLASYTSSHPAHRDSSRLKSFKVKSLQLNSNALLSLPPTIECFQSLITLELSNNQLVQLPREIASLKNLRNLLAKNNNLDDLSFPKELEALTNLEVINLGGNRLKQFPYQLFALIRLREIYLGSNQVSIMPDLFQTLTRVEVLYLGGNQISSVPDSVGSMRNLIVLNLSGNRLRTLPSSVSRLPRLKSLSLHNNQFSALPPEIIELDLQELSLRNNPLVVRFVRELTYDVPTLKELAGRAIKLHRIAYIDEALPKILKDYLDSAKSCLNPKCKGVYFESCHKNVKFVDFCGKFYLPLLQFLCSPTCTSAPTFEMTSSSPSSAGESEEDGDTQLPKDMSTKFKKVLLG